MDQLINGIYLVAQQSESHQYAFMVVPSIFGFGMLTQLDVVIIVDLDVLQITTVGMLVQAEYKPMEPTI